MTLVRDLIEQARIRHWSFTDVQLNDGAAVLWMNQRQKHLILAYVDAMRGRLGTTVETAATVGGGLVGVDGTGTPYFITTTGDGYAVQFTNDGVPFIDTSLAPVTTDPFGENGGTPGWPLPTDVIALLNIVATMHDNTQRDVKLLDEVDRLRTTREPRYLFAFLAGNRMVPVRDPALSTNATVTDRWTDVVSVQLSYIASPTVSAITDTLTLPSPFHEPLIAGLAELFARQCKACTSAERQQFALDARRAESEIAVTGLDVVDDVRPSAVVFKR